MKAEHSTSRQAGNLISMQLQGTRVNVHSISCESHNFQSITNNITNMDPITIIALVASTKRFIDIASSVHDKLIQLRARCKLHHDSHLAAFMSHIYSIKVQVEVQRDWIKRNSHKADHFLLHQIDQVTRVACEPLFQELNDAISGNTKVAKQKLRLLLLVIADATVRDYPMLLKRQVRALGLLGCVCCARPHIL